MSIVSTPDHSPHLPGAPGGPSALLQVVVTGPHDVAGAQEGGADRLLHVVDVDAGGLSPDPAAVSALCRETDLPVRVLLRLTDSHTTTGGELTRLAGLGSDYLAMGAEGLAFGFLDHDLRVDREVCAHLADRLPRAPWCFHRVFDKALEPGRAWSDVVDLPGLDGVLSAGSPQGLAVGADELIGRAAADPTVARLLVAGGGLLGEHVPWLVRAGVRQFQVASSVRPGGSWGKAYVDAAHVRSWRLLLDDETDHATRTAGPRG
jgi:copper homeostasis protein